jgi:hypothetical protein
MQGIMDIEKANIVQMKTSAEELLLQLQKLPFSKLNFNFRFLESG